MFSLGYFIFKKTLQKNFHLQSPYKFPFYCCKSLQLPIINSRDTSKVLTIIKFVLFSLSHISMVHYHRAFPNFVSANGIFRILCWRCTYFTIHNTSLHIVCLIYWKRHTNDRNYVMYVSQLPLFLQLVALGIIFIKHHFREMFFNKHLIV